MVKYLEIFMTPAEHRKINCILLRKERKSTERRSDNGNDVEDKQTTAERKHICLTMRCDVVIHKLPPDFFFTSLHNDPWNFLDEHW